MGPEEREGWRRSDPRWRLLGLGTGGYAALSQPVRTGCCSPTSQCVCLAFWGGLSIRALADYLSHTDPGFTLKTYAD